MHVDKVISEARARIIWGEPASSVHDFLISNGISDEVADAKLAEFNLERSRELRKVGFRNFLIGVVLTTAAGGAFYLVFPDFITASGWAKIYGLLGVIGFYGLWKLGKGLIYLVRPQSEHKSIPEIAESDFIE